MIRTIPRWRLRFISVLASIVVCILIFRIIQIQIVEHEKYRKLAEDQWIEKVKKQARRGNIYSRDGLPLAVTQKTYTLGVTPEDFPKDKEAVRAFALITGIGVRELGRALKRDSRYVQLRRDLQLTKEEIERIHSFSGTRLDPILDRLYPFDALPSRFIGSVGWDSCGVDGIEFAYDGRLRGEDGWSLANIDAKYGTVFPMNAPGKRARGGNDLYLTIDSRIQSITDFELGQAVKRCGAAGGVAIVLDPYTGDILALSEKISPDDCADFYQAHKDALYSVSCIFEPGSIFKLISYSYLLEKEIVGPYEVFFGRNGVAHFDFGVFHDDHEFGWLTVKEAFVYSSNICTIEAMMKSKQDPFYRYILRCGFAGKTGVALPAESPGKLSEPARWSVRSQPSISIGHEIGATVLQMAMVYCALANGGTLLTPRVALEERDSKGKVVKSYLPVTVRRIFSKKTAETMKDFCAAVVTKGTGKKAAVEGIPVGGKTGTAQKAGPNGYMEGRFVASFIGFAPVENPRIVCLVLLDEPAGQYHWGGQSAAVVFGRIIGGLNLTSDFFFEESGGQVAGRYERNGRVSAPSFLRLTPAEAVKVAARWGLQIHCSSDEGVIYSQIPDPGTLVKKGDEIKLIIRTRKMTKSEKVDVPDLRGLSIREARRLLLACGLDSTIKGYGTVRNQHPRPGKTVRRGYKVSLECRPKIKISRPGEHDLAGRISR